MSFFSNFINKFAPKSNEVLDVESVEVDTVESTSDTVTLQASIGLRTVELNVPTGTTYAEVIKLAQDKVPGMNMSDVTVLDTNHNRVIPANQLNQPVQPGSYSLESTSGTAG